MALKIAPLQKNQWMNLQKDVLWKNIDRIKSCKI